MDWPRFDRLAHTLSRADGRRGVLRVAAGALAVGLLAPRAVTPARAQGVPYDPCATPEGNLMLCDGRCVMPAVDHFHCGGCGVVCGEEQVCAEGQCVGRPAPVAPPEPLPPFFDDEPAGVG